MYIFGFEKLQVWKEARIVTVLIYDLTEKFPDKEKFGLTNQMRRASVSIGANIAEGSSRFSAKEQAHFYSISYGSLMELMSHSFTALDLKYLNDEVFEKTKSIVQPLSLKINNLRNAAFAKSEKK
ncbi:MAG: four helix bundle protein [Flavobacterium sp.]|nr:four helix bundle protein [Flavobacterium sp.]